MKGSNSRQNFDAKARFANLYHVQGGMITDADLNERAQIDQARDETIARTAIGNGVPDTGGMIAYDGDTPHLRAGLVFADGKAGRFALSNPAGDKADLGFILANQADFPNAPAIDNGSHLIYADVWDRTVFAGQNAALTDPGLHGTETSYRTKTMVQLKSFPVEDGNFAALLDQMAKQPQFAAKGAAMLSIATKQSDIQVSGCDPCADQITVDDTLPNMLWRLEIVDVQREEGSHTPKTIRVAWSSENASVMDRNTEGARAGLVRDEAVYQFLSDSTEAHQGWLPANFRHQRSAFTDNIENTPGADEDTVYTHVRRWDGMAEVDILSGEITDFVGRTEPKFAGNQLKVQADFFSASIVFDKENAMIGDYWLVEVRRFARDDDQIRLIGANAAGQAVPIGITHQFCPLMYVDEGKPVASPQALRQITQMPTLSTLQAADSGYSPPENCPVFGDADNVQQALDALCALEAKNVAIVPSDCDTLSEVDNVQDALEALCAADNERSLRVMLRTMMDWGVVCGLRLTADVNDPSVIHYTGGTALNREGLLRELPSGSMSLNKLEEAQIHGKLAEIQKLYGEVCLSLELREDRDPAFHLSSPSYPYVDSDKTLKERIADCLQSKDRIDDSDILKKLDEKQMLVLNKVMTSWTNRKAFGRVVELSEEELEFGLEIFGQLSEEFQSRSDDATNARLQTLLKDAQETFEQRIDGSGSNAPNERLRHLVAIFGILASVEAGSQSGCTCDAALPDCAVHGSNKPVLIPIGCIKFAKFDLGKLAITEVCDLCCRKLAHTWQNYRYYYGDQMGPRFKDYQDTCCSYFDDASGLESFLDRWTPTDEALDPKVGSPFWPPDPGITNQNGRNGPDVRGVTVGTAQELLKETGVQLNEEFIFERGENLFERLREALGKPLNRPLGLVFEARKDDEVGLITQKGDVVDLFVIKAAAYHGDKSGKIDHKVPDDNSGASGSIDVSDLDLTMNPGFKTLFDAVGGLLDNQDNGSVSVDGGSLPLATNPSIRRIEGRIDALRADVEATSQPIDPRPPYVLTDDTAFIDVNDRLDGLRNQVETFSVTGDSLDLSNNPTIRDIQRSLTNTGSGGTTPDFSNEFAEIWTAIDAAAAIEIDLENEIAALNGLPASVTSLGSRITGLENATHLTMTAVLQNQTIRKLRTDITALERVNTNQSSEIRSLRGEVSECKQLILRMTPLHEVIKNDNISKLEDRGITTVGAALTAGQDGLARITGANAAKKIMTELDAFLEDKR